MAAKRCLDVFVAATLATALLPVFALLALAVRVTSRGPVLYRDQRVGLGGALFTMYKFRTMRAGAHDVREQLLARHAQPGHPFVLTVDPRLTWIGSLLRRASLDELPQLFNVLRGDMTLVGPRPLLAYDIDHAPAGSEQWKRVRMLVPPGLTGRWQIRTRHKEAPPHDQMVRDDCEYVGRWSMRRDLAMLVRTPLAMIAPVMAGPRTEARDPAGDECSSIALVGGGTAGHIAPALAVREELMRRLPRTPIYFVLARRTPGQWMLDGSGVEVEHVASRPFYGARLRERLRLPLDVVRSFLQVRTILRARRTRLLVVTGGYASFDSALAAASLGIPILVHEANARAGLSNRLAGMLAGRICIGMETTARDFPRSRTIVTGNPVRSAFRNAGPADRGGKARRILVIGGSLGSEFLDRAVPPLIARAASGGGIDISVTHYTGHPRVGQVRESYRAQGVTARVLERTLDMAAELRASDFVISRAGAMSIAEIATVEVAALFVPLPHHAREHQRANLTGLASRAALWWVEEGSWDEESLARKLHLLLDCDAALAQAASECARAGDPQAAAAIADACALIATDADPLRAAPAEVVSLDATDRCAEPLR
ncbi:MAG TPA: sugar transferase [Candidatus Limnocylindrales bacterium]|nr:sugar transferase [Candidatus Limnocylindrales bacterium]